MNLLILYPNFCFRGVIYDFPEGSQLKKHSNLYSGSRQLIFKKENADTSIRFRFDLTGLSSQDRNLNYIYCGGLNLITSYGEVSCTIKGADNSGITTNVNTQSPSNVETSDLYGRKNEDYVYVLSNSVFRDFWEITFSTLANHNFYLRKLFVGNAFYFGVEPDAPASFSSFFNINARLNVRTFQLRWTGVNNDKLAEFMTLIIQYHQVNPIVLYAKDWDGVLNNEKLLYCMINDYSIERSVFNNNTIQLNLTEMI